MAFLSMNVCLYQDVCAKMKLSSQNKLGVSRIEWRKDRVYNEELGLNARANS